MSDDFSEPLSADDPEQLRKHALASLKRKRDFKAQIVVFVLINILLWGIWVIGGIEGDFGFPWPVFATVGWGIGLVMQGWSIYHSGPPTEADVQAEVERLRGQS